MLIVDTNVVVHLLIHGEHTQDARDLLSRDPDWRSEAFLLVEFTNVLVSSIATKRMTMLLADNFLSNAVALFDGKLARMPHATVLAASVRYGVSAYDGRFLALADQLGSPLVTEDARLRSAAPKVTQSLAEALAQG